MSKSTTHCTSLGGLLFAHRLSCKSRAIVYDSILNSSDFLVRYVALVLSPNKKALQQSLDDLTLIQITDFDFL